MEWHTYAIDGLRLIQWAYGSAAKGEASVIYREHTFATERELSDYLWPEELIA